MMVGVIVINIDEALNAVKELICLGNTLKTWYKMIKSKWFSEY